MKTPHAVLDGEVCALDEDGRASFSAMQQGKPGRACLLRVRRARDRRASRWSTFRSSERRERLERLLDRRNRAVRISEPFDDGEALYAAAKEQGFEGIMAKRARLAVPPR